MTTCQDQVLHELKNDAVSNSIDKDLTIFRRFDGLRTFYIYYCQRELVQLEKRLEVPRGQDPEELRVLMQMTGEALTRYSECSLIKFPS
jgi:hypothetical protein